MTAREFVKKSNKEIDEYVNSIQDFTECYEQIQDYHTEKHRYRDFCEILGVAGFSLDIGIVVKKAPLLILNRRSFIIVTKKRKIYAAIFDNRVSFAFEDLIYDAS